MTRDTLDSLLREATVPPTRDDAAEALAEAVGVPLGLLHRLRDINREQWRLEDITRAAAASIDDLARAKRKIDISNSLRHHTINMIDRHVHVLAADRPSAVWYSETVGELCDRLLILDLKRRALREHTATAAPRLAEVERSRLYLAEIAVRMANDVLAGCARLPPRTGMKIYNSAIDPTTIELSGEEAVIRDHSDDAGHRSR